MSSQFNRSLIVTTKTMDAKAASNIMLGTPCIKTAMSSIMTIHINTKTPKEHAKRFQMYKESATWITLQPQVFQWVSWSRLLPTNLLELPCTSTVPALDTIMEVSLLTMKNAEVTPFAQMDTPIWTTLSPLSVMLNSPLASNALDTGSLRTVGELAGVNQATSELAFLRILLMLHMVTSIFTSCFNYQILVSSHGPDILKITIIF